MFGSGHSNLSHMAQNLFMSDGYSGIVHNLGNIYTITALRQD